MAAFKASEERGDLPLARAMEVARCVGAGEGPSSELGQIIVSALCFENNTPSLWKLLDQAIAVRLLSPLHIIALLTARVIPHRRAQPEAYRLYLELLSRYGVALSLRDFGASKDKPEKFNSFVERLQLIEVHKSTLQSLISVNYIWAKLFTNVHEVLDGECKSNRFGLLGVLVDAGLSGPTFNYCLGNDRSACWIPFDIIMENAMDGSHLYAISSVEILTELTKTLQVFNQASWQETFMALFVSALRLVQRVEIIFCCFFLAKLVGTC
ncbi:hypothetical protein KFK09_003170 [Dendrobium nobile]|uniref:Uncharacterized protein n=1 Tax=Dendrobium nobile TaxID=94219 RepID=A0A8T3C9D4_DENNO|nr:hypothetical protein KFK09_003170 [Dendrobium nobile]